MRTLKVSLTHRQVAVIKRLIESGRYKNTSEVLRDGVRLVELRIIEDRARLKKLRAAIQVGLDDVKAGRVSRHLSGEALHKHLRDLTNRARTRQRPGPLTRRL